MTTIEILAWGFCSLGYTTALCGFSIASHIKHNLRLSPEEVLRRYEEGNHG